jgi:hypothetical protein
MNDHRKHARLSASGSHRWLACPGSILLEESYPEDVVSEYAEYGTAGHQLAQTCLEKDRPATLFEGQVFNESKNFPEGFTVDAEMADAVQIYLDYCNSLGEGKHYVEKRVEFSNYVKEGFGTADFVKIKDGEIHVVDLKMGKGVRVNADFNTQGMLYALGVIWDEAELEASLADNDLVHIAIIQPRLDHISEWSITVNQLLTWGADTVRPKAEQAWNGEPIFNPGESQCRFCKAKPTCKALAEHSLQTAMDTFTDIPTEEDLKEVHTLTHEEIGALLPRVNTLVNWAKSLEAHAFNELDKGENIPGYKLVMGRNGNRKWTDEADIEEKLTRMGIRKTEMFSKKFLTPAQICKVLKAKDLSLTQIETYWNSPEGKPTIAVESDSRDEIRPSTGFTDIET